MSSGYNCNLCVNVIALPEDRERAEQCVLDAVGHVFAEQGICEDIPDCLECHQTGEGETECVWLILEMQDIYFDPAWDEDGDKILQEWCDSINKKARELPIKRVLASVNGYWVEREPDISGYSGWNSDREEQNLTLQETKR